MSIIFESIKQGLNEAVDYERGKLSNVKASKVTIAPLHAYTANEIKEIRLQHSMTQRLFAEALGVSVKTVESWECGRGKPSGAAARILNIADKDPDALRRYGFAEW